MGPGDPGGLGPGGPGPGMGLHKGLRSPKSPAADIDWQKIQHQFFDDPKSIDNDLSTYSRPLALILYFRYNNVRSL